MTNFDFNPNNPNNDYVYFQDGNKILFRKNNAAFLTKYDLVVNENTSIITSEFMCPKAKEIVKISFEIRNEDYEIQHDVIIIPNWLNVINWKMFLEFPKTYYVIKLNWACTSPYDQTNYISTLPKRAMYISSNL